MSEARTAAARGVTLDDLVTSWARPLRAADLSARTGPQRHRRGPPVTVPSATSAVAFAADHRMPTDASAIRREHVEAFIEATLPAGSRPRRSPGTETCQQVFKWLVDGRGHGLAHGACARAEAERQARAPGRHGSAYAARHAP